jgi:hypothetical protein
MMIMCGAIEEKPYHLPIYMQLFTTAEPLKSQFNTIQSSEMSFFKREDVREVFELGEYQNKLH